MWLLVVGYSTKVEGTLNKSSTFLLLCKCRLPNLCYGRLTILLTVCCASLKAVEQQESSSSSSTSDLWRFWDDWLCGGTQPESGIKNKDLTMGNNMVPLKNKKAAESSNTCSQFLCVLIETTMLSRGSAFDVRLRLEFMIRKSPGSEPLWQQGT